MTEKTKSQEEQSQDQKQQLNSTSRLTLEESCAKALAFREERDWAQFHNPKDLAISISLEASELLEVFQWSGADLDVAAKRAQATEELADVVIYCIYMADRLGVDLATIVSEKIDADAAKYPVDKARGNAKKYDEL